MEAPTKKHIMQAQKVHKNRYRNCDNFMKVLAGASMAAVARDKGMSSPAVRDGVLKIRRILNYRICLVDPDYNFIGDCCVPPLKRIRAEEKLYWEFLAVYLHELDEYVMAKCEHTGRWSMSFPESLSLRDFYIKYLSL